MTYSHPPTSTCNANLAPSLVNICGTSAFVVFLSHLDKLVRSNEKISGACERVKPIETPDEEYDFVVIGGGGAGAAASGRLSEYPDWKVLLLEAGPDEPPGEGIPLFSEKPAGNAFNWYFTMANESHACLSTNGTCSSYWGKMLGGGTSHSGMIYMRGNPTDFDNWAALGNEGWTWEEVEPFYTKGEDNGEIERVGRKHHGTGGPLSVQRFPYLPKFAYSVLAAAAEAGYGVSEDLNGEKITGFSIAQTASKNGVRHSSAAAYLRPARNRKNLHVSLNSLATRVVVENGKAVGVEYHKDGELKTVRVAREVVVSAGTILSPQILLLSGIGPREHLESVGLKVVKDLPGVGENYHNHVGHQLSFTVDEPDTYDNDWASAAQYLVNQTGPLSGTGSSSVIALLQSDATSPDFPDLQLSFLGYTTSCAPGEVGALNSPGKRTVKVNVLNTHPRSRGRISLASNDPFEFPLIWANYLSDPADLDVLVQGIRLALTLADTKPLRAHNFTLSSEPLEACANYKFPSNDYWKCATRQVTLQVHRMAGSCKMGPSSDRMAVVDPRLRVHGIKGLRVGDISIMPRVTSSNTTAPAMMIGERVADFIKEDWTRDFGGKTSIRGSRSKCYSVRSAAD